VIWLKTHRPDQGLAPALGAALLLAACGQSSPPQADLPTPTPAPEVAASPAAPQPSGLTPLPSANQVLASLPIGRIDPFAPATPVAAPGDPRVQAAAPLALPADFRFSGVLRVGSTPQALVQVGDQIGAVCIGADGRCVGSGQDSLLPDGWGVTAIDVDRGRLTLRRGSQSITTDL
jgi:hypothetical protein